MAGREVFDQLRWQHVLRWSALRRWTCEGLPLGVSASLQVLTGDGWAPCRVETEGVEGDIPIPVVYLDRLVGNAPPLVLGVSDRGSIVETRHELYFRSPR